MARALLIDDDVALLHMLSEYLRECGHNVATASSGADAIETIAARQPDVVVLDVTMPVMDGWAVLRAIRASSDVPVIMVTAHAEERDVLRGFSLGADDYVSKPFSFAQLEARIGAVLARGKRRGGESGIVKIGGLSVDMDARRVTQGTTTVKLTPTEFRLLVALMDEPGRIFSAAQLVRIVWGEDYAAESDYVRRYIWYLRRKIEDDPDRPRYIRNERNAGYYFHAN